MDDQDHPLTHQIVQAGPDALAQMLDLERLETDFFRGTYVLEEPFPLYGGQVLAQALVAAGRTVDPERHVHSLHAYFLRPGDAKQPTVFQVFRDRDGRSYSARRVIAIQNGQVILNMSSSFSIGSTGPDLVDVAMPQVSGPKPPYQRFHRLFSFEGALTETDVTPLDRPDRFWLRCVAALGEDPLLHAAALTYGSDISSGLIRLHGPEGRHGPSLDHAVWFHEPVRAGGWLLQDMRPQRTGAGRGLYSGNIFTEDGRLVATFTQESLFGAPRR